MFGPTRIAIVEQVKPTDNLQSFSQKIKFNGYAYNHDDAQTLKAFIMEYNHYEALITMAAACRILNPDTTWTITIESI